MTEAQKKTIESYDKTAGRFNETIAGLTNYNHTYDFFAEKLRDGDSLLDLACGPAQISGYLRKKKKIDVTGVDLSEKMLEIARASIPDGLFYKHSIIDFNAGKKYNAAVIGFGLPYLNEDQTAGCLENVSGLLIEGGYVYISFMNGSRSRIEKTSFGGDFDFLVYYHEQEKIIKILENSGINLIKTYELDYTEADGSITKDSVIIGQKK